MASRSLLPFSRNMPMSRSGEDTDPFLTLRREMNRLFDDAFGGFGLPSLFGPVLGPVLRHMPATPKVDVSETESELRITAEMPGIDENNVEVSLDDDRLIIRGEKKEEREDKDRNYHVRERVEGIFSRTLPLPFSPEPSQVKADFKNGVLTITLPKPKEVREKQHRIEVQRDTSAAGGTTSSQQDASSAGGISASRAGPAGAVSSTTAPSTADEKVKETAAE
jgi:HSP20 family protein